MYSLQAGKLTQIAYWNSYADMSLLRFEVSFLGVALLH